MINTLRLIMFVSIFTGGINHVNAQNYSTSFTYNVKSAIGASDAESDLLLIKAQPEFTYRINSRWQAELKLRVESFHADMEGGSTQTFDKISKRWQISDDVFSEIEQAIIRYRNRSTRVTLGKQTFAWGVLDGLQVSDRLDAIRRRESIFIKNRPERIPRWSVRAEFMHSDIRWDLGIIFDNTVDQLAVPGSTYEVRAKRFRAGVNEAFSNENVNVNLADKPTVGIKASKRTKMGDFSFLSIHGVDTEPVFNVEEQLINLQYKTRSLIGTTWQNVENNRVWRIEIAYIPDQPVNVEAMVPKFEDKRRWLAGAGLDWDLPNNTFFNAQIGFDYVQGENLVRPNTDIIYTLKLQHKMKNDRLKISSELIGSSHGDGTIRPSFEWQINDNLIVSTGLDYIWGTKNEPFGQFADRDRIWLEFDWFL